MPDPTPKADKKYTVDELSDLYKKQNPQYANIESTTLVNRILRDHPETAKRMDFGNAQVRWTGTTPQILSVGKTGQPTPTIQAGRRPDEALQGFIKDTGDEQMMRNFMTDIAPMAGFPIASRLGTIKGMLASGLASTAGGEAGELMDRATGAGPGEGEQSWINRRGMDFLYGAGTELGGRATAPLIRGVTKPLKFALGGALQDVPKTLREGMSAEHGIHFTPAQAMEEISETTGKPYGVFMRGEESRSYHNPYSRAIAKTGSFARGQAARSTVADLASQIGPDVPENMSMERVANVIKSVGKPTWQRQVDKLKSILNARAARTMVDVTSMRTAAEDELHDIWKQQENLGQVDEEGRPIMPNTSRVKMLLEVSKFPDQMPFSSLVEKRTQWMNVSPQITELLSGEAKGTAKHLTELSTKLLDEAASSGGVAPVIKATNYEFLHSTELTDEGLKGLLGMGPQFSSGDIVGRKLATKLPNGLYKLTPAGVDHALFQEAKLRWQAANPGKNPATAISAISGEANKAKLEGQDAMRRRSLPRSGFTKEWNTFRNFTRKGSDVFESKIITDAMNKNPEEVVGALKGDDITDLLRIRRAIKGYAQRFGTPADHLKSEIAWRKFQNTYLRENVLRPLDGNMTNLDTAIQNLNPAVKKALFDDPQGQQVLLRLTQIGKAMKDADKSLGVLMGHQDPLAHVGSMAISGAGLLAGTYAAGSGHPGLAALGIGVSAINMLRPYIVAKIAWNPTATRLFLRGLAGLAEAPPTNSAVKDAIAKFIGTGAKGALKVGGTMTNRRLGAAMADIVRAYDLANVYEAAKENDQRADEALNKGEISSPQALEMMTPGSITVPAPRDQ